MSSDGLTTVSVVIPCYNYGHFLEDAVTSVLDEQPGVDVRVLIIDDASPDGSVETARKIEARDPRVEVIAHSVNQGHIATYNEGLLEWADGDYCVLMSADDRLTPGSLLRATQLLDIHPNVGFVYGYPVWFMDGDPLPQPRNRLRSWSIWPGHQWLERRFRAGHNCITSPEVVVRTSLQKKVGGYDPSLPHTGDLEMWLRLAAHADVAFVHGVDQAYHRAHKKNMMTSYTALADLRQRRLAFDTVLDRCAQMLPDAARLAGVVHRKLGHEALCTAAREYERGGARQAPVDDLVKFAFDSWPQARRAPAFWTLQLRKRIGPDLMPYLRPFIWSGFASKARWYLRRRSWKWRGY